MKKRYFANFFNFSKKTMQVLALLSLVFTNIVFPLSKVSAAIDESILDLAPEIVESSVDTTSNVPVQTPTWSISEQDSTYTTVESVVLNQTYVFPLNEQVTVKFTELPQNSGKLSIREIKLSQEQKATINSYFDYAYDVTSDMVDGTFKYELTLPKPDNTANVSDVQVAYSESLELLSANELTAVNSTLNDKTFVEELDHFTVFVVVNPNPAGNGNQSDDNCATATITGSVICYDTIQGAVDAAVAGDTINIAEGDFVEQLRIGKSLTINGAGMSLTNIVSPNQLVNVQGLQSVVSIENGATVNINNLTVKGEYPGTVSYLIAGIWVNQNATLNLLNSSVENFPGETNTLLAKRGAAIFIGYTALGQVGHADIRDSNISGYSKAGIIVDNVGSTATIANNWIVGVGSNTVSKQNGIQISRGASAVISRNIIQDNVYSPTPEGSGIYLYGNDLGNVVLTNNIVHSNSINLSITGNIGATSGEGFALGFTATGNTFFNPVWMQAFIDSYWFPIAQKFDVTNNWWFNNDGPYPRSLISANYSFDPFCYDSDCTETGSGVVPVVNAGPDQSVATQPIDQDATASDDGSGIATYQWSMVSGPVGGTITFGSPTSEDTSIQASAEGTYVLRLTVTDNIGLSSYDEAIYTIDAEAPVLYLPADITAEATSPSGAFVDYTVSGLDYKNDPVVVNCTPVSGSQFAIDTTLVTCTATDDLGNISTGSFSVTVEDTTAPLLDLPADLVVEATSPLGSIVNYNAYAFDAIDGDVNVDCLPVSGSQFALGESIVNCTAEDSRENLATGSFKITVQDTTAPSIPDTLQFITRPDGVILSCGAFTNLSDISSDWADSTDSVSGVDSYEYRLDYPDVNGVYQVLNASTIDSIYPGSLNQGQGQYTFSVRSIDGAGNTSAWSSGCSINFDNVAPIISASYSETSSMSNHLNLDFDVVDEFSPVDSISYEFLGTSLSGNVSDIYSGILGFNSSVSARENVDVSTLATGNYDVKVCATDSLGNVSTASMSTVPTNSTSPCYQFNVYVDNQAPEVDPLLQPSDITLYEGQNVVPEVVVGAIDDSIVTEMHITLTMPDLSTYSDSVLGDLTSHPTWSMNSILSGYGIYDADTSVVNEGLYTVEYYFNDNHGNTSQVYSFTVTLENVPPQVVLNSDQTIDEGQIASFTGSFADPSCLKSSEVQYCINRGEIPDDSMWSVDINYGDGTSEALASTDFPGDISIPSHEYATAGVYDVVLKVCESSEWLGEGQCGVSSVKVTVNNVAPVVTVSATKSVMIVTESVTFTADVTGGNSPVILMWVCTNGTTAGNVSSLVLSNLSVGTTSCTAHATDVDGDVDSKTVSVNVFDVLSVDAVATPTSILTTGSSSLTSTLIGGIASFTYTWSCSNGITSNASSAIFTSGSSGTYTCNLVVTDSQFHSASDSVSIVVNLPAPSNNTSTNTGSTANGNGTVEGSSTTNEEEVKGASTTSCDVNSFIKGHLYIDKNGNNSFDQEGEGYQDVEIQLVTIDEKGEVSVVSFTKTTSDGSWEFKVCAGTHKVRVKMEDLRSGVKLTSDNLFEVKVENPNSTANLDISLMKELSFFEMYWWILLLVVLAVVGGGYYTIQKERNSSK